MSRNQIIIVILIFVAAIIVFVFSISGNVFPEMIITGAPQGNDNIPVPTSHQSNKPSLQIPQNASITLQDINGGSAVAQGSRIFQDGVYNIGARAEKLPPLSPGKYYRVWLIRNTGSYDDALALNVLVKAQEGPNKGNYVLGASIKEDVRIYQGMAISLQAMSDQKPNNVILEGAFK